MGQKLKSHILERAGGPVPQLKHIGAVAHIAQGCGNVILKGIDIGTFNADIDLILCKIAQKQTENCSRSINIFLLF